MRDELRKAIANALGENLKGVREVGGGDINRAFRVETSGRLVFVKVNDRHPVRMFEREAAGLQALSEAGALRVPEVLGLGESGGTAFLILEWIETGSVHRGFFARFGESLAALHRHSAPAFGFDHDNFIGSLPQPNDRCPSWLELFRDRRLGAQLDIARHRGSLPERTLSRAESLLARLDRWLPERSVPALLHGDLWGGNYMVGADGRAVLIDPAVYYGDREIELAFTQLFGGFDAAFYDAYQAIWPLPAGHRERRDLYNLYPLLVHANLFGGHYVAQVDATIRRYL